VKAIEQRVAYALLISTPGLIQETKSFHTKKKIYIYIYIYIFRCLQSQQLRATVYFIAGNEGMRMQHHAVKWL